MLNTIDLHYHQRLNFRKLVCYLSEDVLQQREPNLTSYKRLTKKTKKNKKKQKKKQKKPGAVTKGPNRMN